MSTCKQDFLGLHLLFIVFVTPHRPKGGSETSQGTIVFTILMIALYIAQYNYRNCEEELHRYYLFSTYNKLHPNLEPGHIKMITDDARLTAHGDGRKWTELC